jgi:hypothetical protein
MWTLRSWKARAVTMEGTQSSPILLGTTPWTHGPIPRRRRTSSKKRRLYAQAASPVRRPFRRDGAAQSRSTAAQIRRRRAAKISTVRCSTDIKV